MIKKDSGRAVSKAIILEDRISGRADAGAGIVGKLEVDAREVHRFTLRFGFDFGGVEIL